MKITTASLLALLAITSPALADELSPDTIVRGMTIAPPGTVLEDSRIFFSPESGTLFDCKQALDDLFATFEAEDDGIIVACIPVDLKDLSPGRPTYYMRQFVAGD